MIQRGEIYLAMLSPVVGSEQGGVRPVVIVQNNKGNRFSPTVIVAGGDIQPNKTELADPYKNRYLGRADWKKPSVIFAGTNTNFGQIPAEGKNWRA